MKFKRKPDPLFSFAVGDRVIPIDEKWLWRTAKVKLIVTQCEFCKAPGNRGEETIRLKVKWIGGTSFHVWQFAKDYENYDQAEGRIPRTSVVYREH